MRKTILSIALAAPLAVLAAPPGQGPGMGQGMEPGMGRGPGGHGRAGMDPEARRAHMMKRMRMVRTIGLAEALDLSEAEALKARDAMSKFDDRRVALGKQMREVGETLRKAARGDAAAQKGVDEALKRQRDLRAQAQALSDEMFQAVTRDFTPERKAKAALFFHHLRGRMASHMMQLRGRGGGMGGRGGMGPGGMRGMGGPMDRGPGEPPGMGGPRWGMGPGADEPDLEIMPDEDSM
jgi:hypothetical protein